MAAEDPIVVLLPSELIERFRENPQDADRVVGRGLDILAAAALPQHGRDVDLVTMRARCAVLLAEAVRLRARLRDLEVRKHHDQERQSTLHMEFQRLQREAATIDRSLLDLRPESR